MSRRDHFDAGHGREEYSNPVDPNERVRQHMRNDPTWPHFADGLSERAWDVIDTNAGSVFQQHEKWPLSCGEVCQTWHGHFQRAGVDSRVVSGNFVGGLEDEDRLAWLPTPTEHVWLEVDGGLFDPTASQYARKVPEFKRDHYRPETFS